MLKDSRGKVKTLRRDEKTGKYEWGWIILHYLEPSRDFFTLVGTGTMEQGMAWMNDSHTFNRPKRRCKPSL